MNSITHITQSESSTRIFCVGKPSFFIEDWNKLLNNIDSKKTGKDNKHR